MSVEVSAQFTRGDVAVAIAPGEGAFPYSGSVRIFTPGTSTFGVVNRPGHHGAHAVAFDASGRLAFSFRTSSDAPLATDVWASTTSPVASFPFGGVALVYDLAGNLFVAPFASNEIRKYSPAGVLLDTYVLPIKFIAGIDLASDQCTMFAAYVSGAIGRYDVCADKPLPPVPVAPGTFNGQVTGIRILPDGTLLLSAEAGAVRLTQAGTVQRTYAIAAVDAPWVGVALDETGQTFWTVTTNAVIDDLYRIDLATGAVIAGPFRLVSQSARSIAVAGERRAALVGAAPVPALSTVTLLLLAATVAGVAIHRLS